MRLNLALCVVLGLFVFMEVVEGRAKPDDDFGESIEFDISSESKETEKHGHHHVPTTTTTTSTTTTTTTTPAPKKSDMDFDSLEEPEAEPAAAPSPSGGSGVALNSNAGMRSEMTAEGNFAFSGGNYAGYDESCGIEEYSRHCDAGRDMVCSPQTRRCQCDPGVNAVYVKALQKCLKVAAAVTDFSCMATEQCHTGPMGDYSECNTETSRCQCLTMFGSTEVVQSGDKCYLRKRIGDYCVDDASCDASIQGKSICIYKPPENIWPPAPHVIPVNATKMCLCDNDYVYDNSSFGDLRGCLPKGVDENSFCKTDVQCTASLGPLSRCHEGSCQCYDVLSYKHNTVFYKGKCYIQVDMNEPCESDEQCKAGVHPNAVCLRHEAYLPHQKVCQCPANLSCTGKGGVTSTTVASLNLFILAVVGMKVML